MSTEFKKANKIYIKLLENELKESKLYRKFLIRKKNFVVDEIAQNKRAITVMTTNLRLAKSNTYK